jgi:hypothetical protein
MIFNKKQQVKIESFFNEFKQSGKNGFPFSEDAFPSMKVYFGTQPDVLLANIMQIEGVEVFLGKDSGDDSINPLKKYEMN